MLTLTVLREPGHATRGEVKLLMAVLDSAAQDIRRHRDLRSIRVRVIYNNAVEWVCSTDRSWYYSFENCCLLLNLDPEAGRASILQGVSRLRERHRSRG